MLVNLMKKNRTYTDKDGQEKTTTNFFLKCGDSVIPIDVKYFPDKDTKKDIRYQGRRDVLRALADPLQDKPEEMAEEKTEKA